MSENITYVWVLWDWSVAYEEELLGVFTSREQALAAVSARSAIQRIPVNVLLTPCSTAYPYHVVEEDRIVDMHNDLADALQQYHDDIKQLGEKSK